MTTGDIDQTEISLGSATISSSGRFGFGSGELFLDRRELVWRSKGRLWYLPFGMGLEREIRFRLSELEEVRDLNAGGDHRMLLRYHGSRYVIRPLVVMWKTNVRVQEWLHRIKKATRPDHEF